MRGIQVRHHSHVCHVKWSRLDICDFYARNYVTSYKSFKITTKYTRQRTTVKKYYHWCHIQYCNLYALVYRPNDRYRRLNFDKEAFWEVCDNFVSYELSEPYGTFREHTIKSCRANFPRLNVEVTDLVSHLSHYKNYLLIFNIIFLKSWRYRIYSIERCCVQAWHWIQFSV